jgi:DsbC/DsbD-like thiol-disulfide interchange protein
MRAREVTQAWPAPSYERMRFGGPLQRVDLRIAMNQKRFSENPLPSTRFFICLLTAISVLLIFESAARGASIQHGTLDLIAENGWVTPGQSFTIGLHFKLDPGWHIYWENPGDAGEPPRVTWQLPTGITAGEIEWPAPQTMLTSTVMNYVYDNEVLLIIPMRAAASLPVSSNGAKLDASLRLLICSKEMCVPAKAQVTLSLPVKAQPASPDVRVTGLFSTTRAHLPKSAPAGWQFTWAEKKDSFVLRGRASAKASPKYFFPLDEMQIDFSAKQEISPVSGGFQITLRKSNQLTKPVSRLRGVLVLEDGQAYLLDMPAGGSATGHTGS